MLVKPLEELFRGDLKDRQVIETQISAKSLLLKFCLNILTKIQEKGGVL